MPSEKQLTINTVLTTVIGIMLAVFGFISVEAYKEIRATHDAVLGMVPRSLYDVQMTELRTRLTALELDWLKWKDKHP